MPTLLLALLLAVGGPAPAGGTLIGTVVDADGGPLAGATVALYDADTFVTGGASDAEGAFLLNGVVVGSYRVRMSFVGYEAWERERVDVQDGETADLGSETTSRGKPLLHPVWMSISEASSERLRALGLRTEYT